MIRSLLIEGVDIRDMYGLVLEDGAVLNPPPVKLNLLEVPGGDGYLDLTEATGDVRYGIRKDELKFFVLYPENFEELKTELKVKLHGRSFQYGYTFDPGYVYTGRFEIIENPTFLQGDVGYIYIHIYAQPYKSKGLGTYVANAALGHTFILMSGRRSISPTFQTEWQTNIEYKGITYTIQPGTTRVRDIWLHEGENEIYIHANPDFGQVTWEDLIYQNITWEVFKTKRLVAWRIGSEEPTGERLVYIQYGREDL